jgi:hypothetical protein
MHVQKYAGGELGQNGIPTRPVLNKRQFGSRIYRFLKKGANPQKLNKTGNFRGNGRPKKNHKMTLKTGPKSGVEKSTETELEYRSLPGRSLVQKYRSLPGRRVSGKLLGSGPSVRYSGSDY